MPECRDVIVIGTGLYGIAAARTHLDVHPSCRLQIFESDSTLGGVWSSKRMYDSFWTQTVLGMAEFSDRPLVLPDDEETYYGFFPARHITEYLENYVDDHVYFGMSLRDRIMFDCQVMEVAQEGSLWHVTTSKGEFVTPRLIVATGLTSSPNMPALPETKDFGSRIIHQKEYGEWSATDSENVKHVAVLGGGKSAADIVYGCVKDGKQVAWIIRKDGGGPAAFVPAKGSGLYKNSNELLYNRLASCISPSIFPGQSYLAKFLNNTNAGSKVCERIWGLIDAQYRKVADYWRFDGKENGFHDLEPDDKLFWQNDSSGVNQKADFWDVIASKVSIHRANILEFSNHNIYLSDNGSVPADILICATGWKSVLSTLFSPEAMAGLGLPIKMEDQDSKDARLWNVLDHKYEKQALNDFPILRKAPHIEHENPFTPYRLYQGIAPVSYRSIVFLGHVMVGNNFRAAEVQALWAIAYLDCKMSLPPEAKMRELISRTVSWCRKRYPYRGQAGNWFYYDLILYTDHLLDELGLQSHKSGRSSDLWKPRVAADLKGLTDEYKQKYGVTSRADNGKGDLEAPKVFGIHLPSDFKRK